jgi:hypothetical protein
MKLVKILFPAMLCLLALCMASENSKTKHFVGHATLYGMREGIYVHFDHPILVSTLHKDSKGRYYYTNADRYFMPKGLFSWLHKKNKKHYRPYECFCLMCKPTTFFDKQDDFMEHLKTDVHANLLGIKHENKQ